MLVQLKVHPAQFTKSMLVVTKRMSLFFVCVSTSASVGFFAATVQAGRRDRGRGVGSVLRRPHGG